MQNTFFHKVYAYARHLSLDVAAGSLGGGLMVAHWVEVEMPLAWYFLLPLAVWLIYSLDHLLDSRGLKEDAHTPRHQFHYRNRKVLRTIWSLLFLIGVGAALWFLPRPVIFYGLGLGVLVLLHLGLVQLIGNKTSPFLMKEVAIAFIYTAGVWGVPFVISRTIPNVLHSVVMAQFAVLALANLLEFSLFEMRADEMHKQTSFVRALGPIVARKLILLLLAMVFITGMVVVVMELSRPVVIIQMIYFSMGAILGGILLYPATFSKNELYRAFGDLAFILPYFGILI